MQRVLAVAGGIKQYRADPDCLVTPETRACPFCPKPHALWRHGTYSRQVLLPDPAPVETIEVFRLYCAPTGQTVSLLPDFCLPRRQHGPAILGQFLLAYVRGAPLLKALRGVRKEAPSHGVAQSLRDGFLNRRAKLHAYLGCGQAKPPPEVPSDRRPIALVFFGLLHGFSNVARAFVRHGVGFHRRFGQGLA
jgi:hypothetical protein